MCDENTNRYAFILPVFFGTKVVQLVIPFMLMAVTFERYVVMALSGKRLIQTLTSDGYRRLTAVRGMFDKILSA